MRPALAALFSATLTGCIGLPVQQPSNLHLRNESVAQQAPDKAIPVPVAATSRLPPPKAAAKTETYSVSVRNIPAQDLLFALARDAKLNIDLHPGISGTVTINAIDQTLQQILTRLSKQVDMRWEIDGPNLVIMPDTPFLRNYRVDYVNLVREVKVTTEVNSQVSGTDGGTGNTGAGSITHIDSTSKNSFWVTLEKNIKDILHETDKVMPEGSSETTIEKTESQNTSGAMSQKVTQPGAGGKNKTTETVLPESNSARDSATTVKRVNFREAASVIANPETGNREFFVHYLNRNKFNSHDGKWLIINRVNGKLGCAKIS
jgi:general secretion pathway protein D